MRSESDRKCRSLAGSPAGTNGGHREKNNEEMEKEKNYEDGVDAVIDRLKMTEKTSMSREEIHRLVKKGMVLVNLSTTLADVIDSLVMDAECTLQPYGATLSRQDKLNFKRMQKSLRDARKYAKECSIDAYTSEDGQAFADDVDWWYNFVRLVQDRTSDDVQKTRLLLQYVSTMPSILGMFDVKMRDFKRIIP